MRVTLYLGLDDTDMLDDGGTGRLARSVAGLLSDTVPGCRIDGVSRHQLLEDPRVPCTRRNRCSCVVVAAPGELVPAAVEAVRAHVFRGSVKGSDPGLCVAEERQLVPSLLQFAVRVKQELVDQREALALARDAGMILEPLGGTGDGVIGALAAVGLRRTGNDGWLTLWGGIRELDGRLTVRHLLAKGLDAVEDGRGRSLAPEEVVETRGRVRPALRLGRRVLVVRKCDGEGWTAVKPDAKGM